VPLRLAGALHALRLAGDPGLAAAYPPAKVTDNALWAAVSAALADRGAAIGDWIAGPPQTNEVRRAAVLIGVGHWLTARHGLPLILSELGASAGLNLMWDKVALIAQGRRYGPEAATLTLTPDWRGLLPPAGTPRVADRRGIDLNPLNPHAPADALRLLACLWPDGPERLRLTRAAIALAAAPVDRGDAAPWVEARLPPRPGHLHLVYSTIAWQYFLPATRDRITTAIEAAGRAATAAAPLAWFGMEADGQAPGAALTLRLWPGDLHFSCGRADFHGRWVNWALPPEGMEQPR